MSNNFRECRECASKPGTPCLCESCLANRQTIVDKAKEIEALKAELAEVVTKPIGKRLTQLKTGKKEAEQQLETALALLDFRTNNLKENVRRTSQLQDELAKQKRMIEWLSRKIASSWFSPEDAKGRGLAGYWTDRAEQEASLIAFCLELK